MEWRSTRESLGICDYIGPLKPGMTENKSNFQKSVNRPLTLQERDLVRWLVEHSHCAANYLLPQIERLSVTSECTCGCPTIDFALDGVPVEQKGARIISDWLADVDGMMVGVMLFQTNDKISTLEVYSCPGTDKPFGLPAIETMKGY